MDGEGGKKGKLHICADSMRGGAKVESGHIHARFLQGSMGFAQPTSPAPAAGHCVATSVGRQILVLRKEGVGSSLTDLIRPPYLRTHKSSSSFSSPAFISLAWRKERISNRPSPLTSCYVTVTLLCASTFFGGRRRGIYFAGNSKKKAPKEEGLPFSGKKNLSRAPEDVCCFSSNRGETPTPKTLPPSSSSLFSDTEAEDSAPGSIPFFFCASRPHYTYLYQGEGVSSPRPPPFPGKWKKRWGRV